MRRVDADIRFWMKVSKGDGCWLWTASVNNRGYGQFFPENGKLVTAHRYSWILHNGPVGEGICVLHACDVRRCVRPGHLFLGTPADNTADMIQKGRRTGANNPARGSRHGCAKLSEINVRDIRRRYAAGGVTLLALATEYGVCEGTAGRIVKRNIWAHLSEE